MTHHLTIITGASRGMGLCLAQQLLAVDHHLLCISRGTSAKLAPIANQMRSDSGLIQWQADLADAEPVASRLTNWLADQNPANFASATLINNAAVMPPIAPLHASDSVALSRAIRVGLEAPMLLSAAFLAATRHWQVPRKVLNISSGLGRRPMASQAAYCAVKAGMDHFTRCLALDEACQPNGARVCSLAPGIIDTNMQLQLRTAAPSDFPDQAAFAHLHLSGQLTSAEDAAARVLAYLQRIDFGSQAVADVRE